MMDLWEVKAMLLGHDFVAKNRVGGGLFGFENAA